MRNTEDRLFKGYDATYYFNGFQAVLIVRSKVYNEKGNHRTVIKTNSLYALQSSFYAA